MLVAGGALWAVLVAVSYVALGHDRAWASTFHYFTDTVGGMLLGTAIVCVAALVGPPRLDRCQPRCDLRHSRWLT